MKGDVLPIRPWEQAARLLDYGYALPTGTSVGTLVSPGSVSEVTSTRAVAPTLADPPDSGNQPSNRETALDANGDNAVRIGIGILGVIVVVGLLLWARQLNRRR